MLQEKMEKKGREKNDGDGELAEKRYCIVNVELNVPSIPTSTFFLDFFFCSFFFQFKVDSRKSERS